MENNETHTDFLGAMNQTRSDIKVIATYINEIKKVTLNRESNGVEDIGEMVANLTLAYRHLEDASMRIGKVIQAHDGGVSVYDKNTTVGVNTAA